MENCIVIRILVVVMAFALLSSIKHFKGEGGCCGGGSSYRPKRKKLSAVKYQKTFRVGGMHCAHCKRRLEESVNDIKGIAGKVDLKKGTLTVSYAEDVDDEVLQEKTRQAGYTVEESSNG